MNPDFVVGVLGETVIIALKVGSPFLLVGLVVGLSVSLFQALTQLQEPSLVFIPKAGAVVGLMVILGPWVMELMTQFVIRMFNLFGGMGAL
jgi:flagellar biosynthetic protein FliQ